MNNHVLVSILINNYNYAQFLRAAIDSALAQTYSNIEIILVDDGSTDHSREIITSYGESIVPILKENGGQASAFNAGFAASRGDIVCFLDSDDVFLPEKITEIVTAFQMSDDIGWVFHSLRKVDVETKPLPESCHVERPSGVVHDFRMQLRQGKTSFLAPATSGLCFSRAILEKIMPMPEAARVTINDIYLKLVAIGLSKGVFIGKSLCLQRIHEANAYTRHDNQQVRARVTLMTAYWMRKNFPEFTKLANHKFAFSLALYGSMGGVEPEYKPVVREYFSATPVYAKMLIVLRFLYHKLWGLRKHL